MNPPSILKRGFVVVDDDGTIYEFSFAHDRETASQMFTIARRERRAMVDPTRKFRTEAAMLTTDGIRLVSGAR